MTAESNHRSRPAVSVQWIIWGLLILIAYPLSLGPIYLILTLTYSSGTPVNRFVEQGYHFFYAPLQWLCEAIPLLETLMESYVMFWLIFFS